MVNRFEKYQELHERLFKLKVAKNEHLILPYSHILLSCFCKPRIIFGGEYGHNKIFINSIQNSGSGKGKVAELESQLLRDLGYNVEKVNKFTEAGIIGSIVGNKIKRGKLAEVDYLDVDEARTLFTGGDFKGDLLEVYNGYCDSLHVNKVMQKGNVKYTGKAVVSTSTFYTEKIREVLQTGLIARGFLTYRRFSQEEMKEISKETDKLAEVDYLTDIKPLHDEIKYLLNGVDQKQYLVKTKECDKYVIKKYC